MPYKKMKTAYALIAVVFLVALGAFFMLNGQSAKLTEESTTLPAEFSFLIADDCGASLNGEGKLLPGACCTADSQCVFNKCGCKRGGDKKNDRCCHLGDGKQCYADDECQSGKCGSTGWCKDNPTTLTDKRPKGDACSVNEDCLSGKCANFGNGWVCT